MACWMAGYPVGSHASDRDHLSLRVAARPVGAHGLSFVEAPRVGIGHTHQGTVVGPAQIGVERRGQFPTRWVGNCSWIGFGLRFPIRWVGNPLWVRQVELTKVAEIGRRETLAITICQLLSQAFD
jgi:hypothetical protein